MNYLLDTNVVSEALRAKPNQAVAQFLSTLSEESAYLSALTLGEIRKGVEALANGPGKHRLRAWLEDDLRSRFEGRLLSIDARVSDAWGRMLAGHRRPASAIDGLIAATALVNDCTVVTRNVGNFTFQGLRVLDPFAPRTA
ncbi:MAG TPA: type II toxin-antitoxin system VapC family toxin [Polyangiaceae bacterium]